VNRAARTASFHAHFHAYAAGLRTCRQLAVKALGLIAAGTTGDSLERTERRLSEELRPLGFVSMIAQREVERATDLARRDGTEQDFLRGSQRLFEALLSVIDELMPQLESAVGRLSGAEHGRSA
jgi:hypothetical protein